jgi:hypothetical protein
MSLLRTDLCTQNLTVSLRLVPHAIKLMQLIPGSIDRSVVRLELGCLMQGISKLGVRVSLCSLRSPSDGKDTAGLVTCRPSSSTHAFRAPGGIYSVMFRRFPLEYRTLYPISGRSLCLLEGLDWCLDGVCCDSRPESLGWLLKSVPNASNHPKTQLRSFERTPKHLTQKRAILSICGVMPFCV